MTADGVRWGVLGVGDVVEVKSGPALQQARGSSLVAVMRRDGDKARDFARRHGVARAYDDADELLADPEVDAVYVATPPDSHLDLTRRAAAAGKPVYVEKPMARDTDEAEQMLAACAAAGVPLFTAFYRRAVDRTATVARLLGEGAVGEPRAVVVRLLARARPAEELGWRVVPETSGGGLFVDLASHGLDLLDHLLGPLQQVCGSAGNQAGAYRAEDTVVGSFATATGVRGTGLWCMDADEDLDEIEVIGTTGSLRFSSLGGEPLRLRAGGREHEVPAPMPDPVQLPLVQTVVDELLGRGTAASTGVSGLRTVRVVDTLLESWRTGRKA